METDWELEELGYPQMKHIVNRLPKDMEERCLARGIVIEDPASGITDEEIFIEILSCRNLKSLVLTGVPNVSDRTIIELARLVPELQGLNVNGCKFVSDVSVLELVARAPPLQYLYVGGGVVLTDPVVCAIARTFSKLVELDLSDGPLVSPVSVRDVWAYSRRLTRLSLARCPLLTDAAFPCRIKERGKRPAPEDKPLPHRPSTWIGGLEPLMLRHTSVDMRVLDLSGLREITDEAIAGVMVHCPSLVTLSLAGCTKLTDDALESVSALGVSLQLLNVAHIPQITDRGIMKLARACTELRSIDLACE